jgi:cytochrome b561
MAMAAVMQPGPLRDYYKRRRASGLHHASAVTAVALKLCRIAWRMMTDQRDYTPEPPTRPQPAAVAATTTVASPKKRRVAR